MTHHHRHAARTMNRIAITVTPRDRENYADTRLGGVDWVVAPVTLNVGHSLFVLGLVLFAVCVQLAYHRSRKVQLARSREAARFDECFDECFYPGIRLSELEARMNRARAEKPVHVPARERRSIIAVLQDMTVIG
jgi:hypothetical protein